jgi:hypothetical protein
MVAGETRSPDFGVMKHQLGKNVSICLFQGCQLAIGTLAVNTFCFSNNLFCFRISVLHKR